MKAINLYQEGFIRWHKRAPRYWLTTAGENDRSKLRHIGLSTTHNFQWHRQSSHPNEDHYESRNRRPRAPPSGEMFSDIELENGERCMIAFEQAVVLVTLNLIMCLVGTIGNVCVCATILWTPSLRLTTSSHCVVNLALADLTVTTLVQPMAVGIFLGKLRGTCFVRLEYAARLIGGLSCAVSISTLALMSIERCLVISRPFRCKRYLTSKKLRRYLYLIWLASFAFPCVDAFAGKKRAYPLFAASVLVIMYGIIVACYSVIFSAARERSRLPSALQSHRHRSVRESDRRLSRTIALVIGMFSVCWAPFVVYVALKPEHNFGSVYMWILSLGFSNSGINPFIYFFRGNVFRQALWNIIVACFNRTHLIRPIRHTRSRAFDIASQELARGRRAPVRTLRCLQDNSA